MTSHRPCGLCHRCAVHASLSIEFVLVDTLKKMVRISQEPCDVVVVCAIIILGKAVVIYVGKNTFSLECTHPLKYNAAPFSGHHRVCMAPQYSTTYFSSLFPFTFVPRIHFRYPVRSYKRRMPAPGVIHAKTNGWGNGAVGQYQLCRMILSLWLIFMLVSTRSVHCHVVEQPPLLPPTVSYAQHNTTQHKARQGKARAWHGIRLGIFEVREQSDRRFYAIFVKPFYRMKGIQ